MDAAQFKRWLKNHSARFPGIPDWLAEFKGAGELDPSGKDIVEGWFRDLADVAIVDAIWATEEMSKGNLALPMGYGETARTVRRYALSRSDSRTAHKRRYQNGERLYDCGRCQDRGFVEVWTGKFLAWARETFAGDPPRDWFRWMRDERAATRPKGIPVSACVRCDCAAGRAKNSEAVRFDPSRDVVYDPFGLGAAIEASPAGSF